jgi:hypothetical protein
VQAVVTCSGNIQSPKPAHLSKESCQSPNKVPQALNPCHLYSAMMNCEVYSNRQNPVTEKPTHPTLGKTS